MPSASSPIAYPSSPPQSVAKRRPPVKAPDHRKPRTIGGFLLDEESDGDDDFSLVEPAPKRRMLSSQPPTSPTEDQVMEAELSSTPRGGTATSGLLKNGSSNSQLPGVSQAVPLVPRPTTYPAENRGTAPLPSFLSNRPARGTEVLTCSGKSTSIQQNKKAAALPFEQLVAARSTTKAGRAKKSYYGIDIHQLIDDASKETEKDKKERAEARSAALPSVEPPTVGPKRRRTLMWTEKYRARNFMELVGDDRTHRQVLRWLKATWDPIVFPHSSKKSALSKRPGAEAEEEKPHRKILILAGPPGLGKTTLAHVCARQAGYEVMEINASDERSSDVVKNRIRTSVGTESVKTGSTVTSKTGHVQKVAHPLCVVVDEVDGVVSGSGGSGEGGFIRALIDLILLDEKNSSSAKTNTSYRGKLDGLAQVRGEFEFLTRKDSRGASIVEVKPFIGCVWF